MFLSNRKFILAVCAVSFVVAGLIFSDRVFGLSVNPSTTVQQPLAIPAPTNISTNSTQAVNVSYLNSAGYLNASSNLPWNKLTGFPSSCSSGYYVSAVGSSLTCTVLPTITNSWASSGSNIYSNNSGYVGIGNSYPSYKLDVYGTINASNALCISGTCKNTWNDPWSNLTNFPSSCSSGQYVSGVGASSLTCSTPSSAWSSITGFPSSCSSGYYVSGVGSSLACTVLPAAATNYWTVSGSYLYNNSGSYVGIGNTNPSYKFDVSGDTRLGGNVGIATTPNSSYPLNVSGRSYLNGNVGVGTTPSTYALDVSGSINASNALCISGSCKNTWAQSCSFGQYVSGVGASSLTCSTPSNSWTSSGSNIYSNNSGYVGIGNSYPSYKLDVYGTINASNALCIYGSCKNSWDWIDSGSYIYPINSSYIKMYDSGRGEFSSITATGGSSSFDSVNVYRLYASDIVTTNKGIIVNGSYSDFNGSVKFRNGTITLQGASLNFDNLVSVRGAYDYTYGDELLIDDFLSVSDGVYIGGKSYLNGNVGIGTSPSYSYTLSVSGNANVAGTLSATTKNFVIDYPLDPENKQLVHSTLEGPEIAVFYRGEAQLENGKVEVKLPDYFEALTRKDGRTVLLTPKFDNLDEPISQLAASGVENGKFQAKSIDNNSPNQKFYWEVKAVRADVLPLEVERVKTEKERVKNAK